ncbi:hypothetical protein I0C86_25815 [Plantactinospora sp. S1510]|uniref:Uncharacterized protein n=1 Tax=Plantactinospora alkalitolerans TaxID=2789879 RepID=A0ABS0H283_9ACTN|nr:hypothetical protein [Plantactinospora alkalitolerans]MBF9132338.1 hypothetical protein [Plantactinospora alkalitolerans]
MTMKLRRRMKPYHRRNWRRLWRYCRCGYRWRCPDSVELVPMPYPPPPPLSRTDHRAAVRVATSAPARADVPAPPARTGTTNRRQSWDAPTPARPTNGRTGGGTPTPRLGSRHTTVRG